MLAGLGDVGVAEPSAPGMSSQMAEGAIFVAHCAGDYRVSWGFCVGEIYQPGLNRLIAGRRCTCAVHFPTQPSIAKPRSETKNIADMQPSGVDDRHLMAMSGKFTSSYPPGI